MSDGASIAPVSRPPSPEADTGTFCLGPADRTRLARYLEVPSAEDIDPVTRQEIDQLDRSRGDLLSFWKRSVAVPIERIDDRGIELEGGVRLRSVRSYGRQLQAAEADWLIVTAFTVGPLIGARIRQHLAERDVFEAFVLNQWAAVMTEQARTALTQSLRAWADRHGRSLLPYHGPGYNGWPLEDTKALLRVLDQAAAGDTTAGVQADDCGGLQPLHSMAIVHGATPRRLPAPASDALAQCHRCAMRHCRYRVARPERALEPSDLAAASFA